MRWASKKYPQNAPKPNSNLWEKLLRVLQSPSQPIRMHFLFFLYSASVISVTLRLPEDVDSWGGIRRRFVGGARRPEFWLFFLLVLLSLPTESASRPESPRRVRGNYAVECSLEAPESFSNTNASPGRPPSTTAPAGSRGRGSGARISCTGRPRPACLRGGEMAKRPATR